MLKKVPIVYVKSLTMHLAIVLREFGVNVVRWTPDEDYEVKEFPLTEII
jgi:hypothetical protein